MRVQGLGLPGVSDGKESACNVGDLGSTPGLGRSPGGGHGNPLKYSCLENPHGQRSLAGYSPWGRKELDTTEQLSLTQILQRGAKAKEPEIKLPTTVGLSKKQESSGITSTSALLTIPKPLTVWTTTNSGKFFNRKEYQNSWPVSWEICMQVKKQ